MLLLPKVKHILIQKYPNTMQLLIHFITILLTLLPLSTTSQPHHLHKPPRKPPQSHHNNLIESIELTPPLSTATHPPNCAVTLLHHSFANTYNQPPVSVPYSPPHHCPPPWSSAVLHLHGTISGEQYDRISAVWLGGAELLRTSTPEPSDNGTFWNVYKDITRYSSLLQRSDIKLSMMLENLVNEEFTGIYNITLTLLLYKDHELGKETKYGRLGIDDLGGSYGDVPADMVIPVSDYEGSNGVWFRIENDFQVGRRSVQIPKNAKKIVLELYVSYHGDDEFWYSNPPNEYITINGLDTKRGNGAFREVIVKIDGKLVCSEVPSPVIFTGGINPLAWEPVVAIGAFNLPSYDFDLTPFLGLLVDGKSHSIEIGVANAIGLWLVDANLHVWVDKGFYKVDAKLVDYQPPQFYESREYEFNQLDGSFKVEAVRTSSYAGWVASSLGNFTTSVIRKMHITSSITFENGGTYKIVEHKGKVKSEVSVLTDMGLLVSSRTSKRKTPLTVITSTVPGAEKDTSMMITNITHGLREKFSDGVLFTSIDNNQVSGGWMLVKDHSVLSGTATTHQTLNYQDPCGCLSRTIKATEGKLLRDNSTTVCPKRLQNVLYKLSDV